MRIVIVGLAGVPFSKRAIDVRLKASIQLFQKLGYQIDVLNRYMTIKENNKVVGYNLINPFPGIKCKGKVSFIFYYLVSLLYEPWRLISMNRKKAIDVLFVNSGHFADMVVYKIIGRLIGAKIVYQYCEYRAAFNNSNPYHLLNGKLIGKYGAKLWDGAICITSFLEKECKRINPFIKTMKMYPICNFDDFKPITPYSPGFEYVMFCGSIEYQEVIGLIVDAYNNSLVKSTKKCLMVLRGNKTEIETFHRSHPEIIIENNLSYADLIARYKGASALMIPLRNNVRDIARFPNKICEYCASHGIVVTSHIGEMKSLFRDSENAFVSEDFSVVEFAHALDRFELFDDKDAVSKRSYQLGLDCFDIESYRSQTISFMESLIKK